MRRALSVILLTAFVVSGCAVNPVTGKKELSLVSEEQELSIGKQQYSPMRQSQGGDYVVDPGVQAYVNSVGRPHRSCHLGQRAPPAPHAPPFRQNQSRGTCV